MPDGKAGCPGASLRIRGIACAYRLRGAPIVGHAGERAHRWGRGSLLRQGRSVFPSPARADQSLLRPMPCGQYGQKPARRHHQQRRRHGLSRPIGWNGRQWDHCIGVFALVRLACAPSNFLMDQKNTSPWSFISPSGPKACLSKRPQSENEVLVHPEGANTC